MALVEQGSTSGIDTGSLGKINYESNIYQALTRCQATFHALHLHLYSHESSSQQPWKVETIIVISILPLSKVGSKVTWVRRDFPKINS